jgi:hypothetical protein
VQRGGRPGISGHQTTLPPSASLLIPPFFSRFPPRTPPLLLSTGYNPPQPVMRPGSGGGGGGALPRPGAPAPVMVNRGGVMSYQPPPTAVGMGLPAPVPVGSSPFGAPPPTTHGPGNGYAPTALSAGSLVHGSSAPPPSAVSSVASAGATAAVAALSAGPSVVTYAPPPTARAVVPPQGAVRTGGGQPYDLLAPAMPVYPRYGRVLCCVVLCCVVLRCVVLCCVVLCCVVLCRVVSCRVVWCRSAFDAVRGLVCADRRSVAYVSASGQLELAPPGVIESKRRSVNCCLSPHSHQQLH